MIPSAWVRLDALPTSTNGKLDRAALPAPQIDEAATAFAAPTTPLEITLAEIWADVLKLDRVDIGTDLFALGADSINLFQITARAHREGVPLMAKQLLKHRTIAELAKFLETAPPQPVAARAPRELVRSSAST
jgi:aryl carrier-like protein